MRLAGLQWGLAIQMPQYETPGWIAWHSSRQMNDLSFQKSPDKSQISYFLLCNYIGLFIPVPVARLESDRLLKHAQSRQLAGDKSHTILPGWNLVADLVRFYCITVYNLSINSNYRILAAELNYRITQ